MGLKAAFFDETFQAEMGQNISDSLFSTASKQHMKSHRIRTGEDFLILNGKGSLWTLEKLSEKNFLCKELKKTPPLEPTIHLIMSPPVGESLFESVQQATEIGASQISFIRTQHCQYKKGKMPNFARLQRISQAACAQCARAWSVQINEEFASLENCLSSLDSTMTFVADESLAVDDTLPLSFCGPLQIERVQTELKQCTEARIAIIIGPEGGWSAEELKILKNKATPLSLGSLILRVPTACVAAIFAIKQLWHSTRTAK